MSATSRIRRWNDRGLQPHLHGREFQDATVTPHRVLPVYGHSAWVHDLDIVNELSGHSGCVNALSWSKSGRLLASGSDDKHLNIQRYQPDDSHAQFSLATTVATGHSANIFSVKFMPHSNDQTVVTCAGDGEVRVFDIERAGASSEAFNTSHAAMNLQGRSRRFPMFEGVRYMTDGNTNCRVYRSHGDRVKRIVTESSPHLFLTCSEDGEVRQWDLRQPSSAYPRPAFPRLDRSAETDTTVPPPLISYKRFSLDLNTISCSASQPYYIALGGAHLHCFLHDRRMLGRDRQAEAGRPAPIDMSSSDDDLMGEATRCVRRFAPHGQQRMSKTESGHITACKISDTNPNEMIVSWSGEHIYSFDIGRSPDAEQMSRLVPSPISNQKTTGRSMQDIEKKRKREDGSINSLSGQGQARANSRPRTGEAPGSGSEDAHMALRVHYGNGQAEDIPIIPDHGEDPTVDASDTAQNMSNNVARRVRELYSAFVDHHADVSTSREHQANGQSFATTILRLSASLLPEIRKLNAAWRYPVDAHLIEVDVQRHLREVRESVIRFVQGCGVLGRALGGTLQNTSPAEPVLSSFDTIQPLDNEGPDFDKDECFRYDFLRAIFLWLDSGIGALLTGFTKDASSNWRVKRRYTVPSDADIDAIEEHLIPLLSERATSRPVVDCTTSRFEVDSNRNVFATEQLAVQAFAEAIQKPFADLTDQSQSADGFTQSRQSALDYWGATVGRGVLRNAFANHTIITLSHAFGDSGPAEFPDEASEVDTFSDLTTSDSASPEEMSYAEIEGGDVEMGDDSHDDDDDNDDKDSDHYDDDDNEEHDDEDDDDELDSHDYVRPRQYFQSALDRRQKREGVEADVPCIPHTRVYRGHCNVKTVKDVNFYGLQDDYVVSGSDDGNFFIWDRKTCKLLNILEGDGEVVNVVQGHPYEPMLAVSGIDNTIKIFSSDARARQVARAGVGIEAADASAFTSLGWSSRSRNGSRAAATEISSDPQAAPPYDDDELEPDPQPTTPRGLASRRRMRLHEEIIAHNDESRQGGNQEAYITVHDLLRMMMMRQAG